MPRAAHSSHWVLRCHRTHTRCGSRVWFPAPADNTPSPPLAAISLIAVSLIGVPYPTEIVGAPIEDHLPLITPSVAVVLVVERLVEVSHKVHDELQGLRLCGSTCCWVPQI